MTIALAVMIAGATAGWYLQVGARRHEAFGAAKGRQHQALDAGLSLEATRFATVSTACARRAGAGGLAECSPEQARPALERLIADCRLDCAWLFSASGDLACAARAPAFPLPQPTPDRSAIITDPGLVHGFAWTSAGLIEIRGEPLRVESGAPNAGTLRGFFYTGRRWSRDFLVPLERVTGCDLTVGPALADDAAPPLDDEAHGVMNFTRLLPDVAGRPIAVLTGTHTHVVQVAAAEATTSALWFLGATISALMLAYAAGIRRWFGRPLRQLTSALQRESVEAALRLQSDTEEFGEIGRLTARAEARKRQLRAEVEYRVGIERDVERARDRALEGLRHRAQFLANMSHEIRTPMNGVIGMLRILSETGLDDEQRDCVATVSRSAVALLGVINDILDFSKIEAGKMAIESIDFELRTAIEDTVELVVTTATERNLDLLFDIDTSVPSVVAGDGVRVRQIMNNLLGNAVKFTERGSVTVTATADQLSPTHCRVRLVVTDTGIGIAPERHAQIFEPFMQADGTTTRRFGGTGLGLTITRELVQLMGGTLTMKSELGVGSEFTVELPFEIRSVPLIRHGQGRVLLAVADPRRSKAIEHQIQTLGRRVTPAASASDLAEAIAATRQSEDSADVILADAAYFAPGEFLAGPVATADRAAGRRHVAIATRRTTLPVLPTGVRVLFVPFRLDVLRKAVERIAPATGSHPLPARTALLQGVRILLAEDNIVNQKVALKTLRLWGCVVDCVGTGRDAVDAVTHGQYDLVLMDCQMPEMDGYEATRHLRARAASSGTRVPILAMTAHAMEGDREKCLAAGMDDYITKPIIAEALQALLLKWTAHAPTPGP